MNDYSTEKRRRILQFQQSLAPMQHRATQLVRGSCIAIFQEQSAEAPYLASLRTAAERQKVMPLGISDEFDGAYGTANRLDPPDLDADLWNSEPSPPRFVQFLFLEYHFEMDLPRPMLLPSEARKIMQTATGFHYLGERGHRERCHSEIQAFRPLRKAYVHGDLSTAAEDMAFLFFELWRAPVDTCLYLSTFSHSNTWEHNLPLR